MNSEQQVKQVSDQRIALVTGASRGLGCAVASGLAREDNIFVIGTATTEAGASKITQLFAEEKISGCGIKMNVCDEDEVKTRLGEIKEKYGSPTILINNAGITRDTILLRMKASQWDEVIETNLTAIFRLSKLCLKPMLRKRWGRIINMSSVVGVTGNVGQANYVSSKAGLIGFTKALALEFAGYGITVNAIAPGFIESEMTAILTEKQQEAILSKIPMQRMGCPEDIAYAVRFLVDDRANYISGQTLHVNGGMCMV